MLTSKGFKRYLMTGTLESILGRLASHNYWVNNWVVHWNPWSNQVETLCIRCNCYRVENTTYYMMHHDVFGSITEDHVYYTSHN